MNSGSDFTYGDKMWVDVNILSYITGKMCVFVCGGGWGGVSFKKNISLFKITFLFLVPTQAM